MAIIILIPTTALALVIVLPLVLYHRLREQRQRRAIVPLPPGTPGGQTCLSCDRAYSLAISGPCPNCLGTLAPPSTMNQE
jgi:hypothetical protein